MDHVHTLKGIVVKGHGVASGQSKTNPYPKGTLELQRPFFEKAGLSFEGFYLGTLNVSISPKKFRITKPLLTLPLVNWIDTIPPETFSFAKCSLKFRGDTYDALIYYPHPETKVTHFQDPSMIEIITRKISGLKYGEEVELLLNKSEIEVF